MFIESPASSLAWGPSSPYKAWRASRISNFYTSPPSFSLPSATFNLPERQHTSPALHLSASPILHKSFPWNIYLDFPLYIPSHRPQVRCQLELGCACAGLRSRADWCPQILQHVEPRILQPRPTATTVPTTGMIRIATTQVYMVWVSKLLSNSHQAYQQGGYPQQGFPPQQAGYQQGPPMQQQVYLIA